MFKGRVYLILLVPAIIMLLTSCDHNDLTGTIIVPETEVKVGERIPLILEVPEELSEIHDTMWSTDPPAKREGPLRPGAFQNPNG